MAGCIKLIQEGCAAIRSLALGERWLWLRRAQQKSSPISTNAPHENEMIHGKRHQPLFTNTEMDALHRELRESSREGHEWRLAALDRILANAEADPATFRRSWIQPLLAAGLSIEVAVARVVDSYFRPN